MTVKFTVKLLHKLTQTTERGNNMGIGKRGVYQIIYMLNKLKAY